MSPVQDTAATVVPSLNTLPKAKLHLCLSKQITQRDGTFERKWKEIKRMSIIVRGFLSTKREETLQTLQKYTSVSLLYQLITARLELDTQGPSELLSSHSRSPQVQPGVAQGLSRVPGAARRSCPAAQVRRARRARLPSGAARPSRAAPRASRAAPRALHLLPPRRPQPRAARSPSRRPADSRGGAGRAGGGANAARAPTGRCLGQNRQRRERHVDVRKKILEAQIRSPKPIHAGSVTATAPARPFLLRKPARQPLL